jgi:hypothetical protein
MPRVLADYISKVDLSVLVLTRHGRIMAPPAILRWLLMAKETGV